MAQATTPTWWTGTTNGNWTTSGNWTTGLPSSTNVPVYIAQGTANITSTISVYDYPGGNSDALIISNTAGSSPAQIKLTDGTLQAASDNRIQETLARVSMASPAAVSSRNTAAPTSLMSPTCKSGE